MSGDVIITLAQYDEQGNEISPIIYNEVPASVNALADMLPDMLFSTSEKRYYITEFSNKNECESWEDLQKPICMRKFLILCILIPFMGMSQLVDSPVVRPDSTYIHSNEVDTARKQITFKDTTTFLAYLISDQAQLEKITEGGHTGWAILGRTAANYGDIGSNAVDLTLSYATSSTYGATGSVSFSTGRYTTASGEYSASFGNYYNSI